MPLKNRTNLPYKLTAFWGSIEYYPNQKFLFTLIEFDNEEESVADQITKTLDNDDLPNLTDKEIQEASTKIQAGLKDYEVRKLKNDNLDDEDEVTEDIKETEVDANLEEDLIEEGSSILHIFFFNFKKDFSEIISHKKNNYRWGTSRGHTDRD